MFYLEEKLTIRGTIVDKRDESLILKVLNSNQFWDATDLAPLGEVKVKTSELDSWKVGDTVIIQLNYLGWIMNEKPIEKNDMLDFKVYEAKEIYNDKFEPLGVDWKVSLVSLAVLPFILLFVLYLISLKIFWRTTTSKV